MIERAGLWRRGLAAFTDLIVSQILLQGLVALLFAASAGHVTSGVAFYTACNPVVATPVGVALPPGFVATSQRICTSSVFGAPTRNLYVASREEKDGALATTTTFSAAISPDGGVAISALNLDALFYPLFILLRWASDRFARGSLGRRLARIAVTDVGGTASGAELPPLLARRYARFAWPYAPGTLVLALSAVFGATSGAIPSLLVDLNWVVGSALIGVAQLTAAMAVFRHQDTFYDAPSGTAVATRSEIARAADMRPEARVVDGLGPIQDVGGALRSASRSPPWVSLGLLVMMAAVFLGEVLFPWKPAGRSDVAVETLMAWGGMDRELVVLSQQPYRLLAAIFVHANATHLLVNAFALIVAGFLLEGLLGPVLFGAVFLLGGLAGSAASITFNPPQLISVGASGGILALFAAALAVSVRVPAGNARRWLQAWPIVVCIPAVLPVVAIPGALVVDRADHAGGEVGGLLLGIAIALAWRNGSVRRPSWRMGITAAAGLAVLAGITILVGGGLRAPIQAIRLVPPGESPSSREAWMQQAPALAERYPDDPRALEFLAQAEVLAHRPAEALRDLDRALAVAFHVSPSTTAASDYTAHVEIGGRFVEIGDLDAAIAQYTLALASRQDDVVAFRQRGIAEYYRGQADRALQDLDDAVKLEPVDPYAALWDDIVAVRSGQPNRRALLERAIQGRRWPAPVLNFYRDDIGAAALELFVADPDPAAEPDRRCEADFYRGERLIMRNDAAAARPLMVAAASECPPSFIEKGAAQEELAGHGGLPAR